MTRPARTSVSGRCRHCSNIYVLDTAWRAADKEQRNAWRDNSVERQGTEDRCAPCTRRAEEKPAKVAGRCVTCTGLYVLDSAWTNAGDEQRAAWTDHRLARRGRGEECSVCTSASDVEADAVIAELYARELAALDDRIANGHPGNRPVAEDLDDDWVAQLSLEGLSAEMSLVRVLAELAASIGPAPGRWTERASCTQFAIDYCEPLRGVQDEAKAVCLSGCPVRAKCLDYALTNPEGASDGVWGGETQKSLSRIRREAKHAAYAARDLPVPTFGVPYPEFVGQENGSDANQPGADDMVADTGLDSGLNTELGAEMVAELV